MEHNNICFDKEEHYMNKSIMILLSLIFLCSCSQTASTPTPTYPLVDYSEYITIQAQAVLTYDPQSLADLTERADCIIQGTLRDDAYQNLQIGKMPGIILYGVTVSILDVTAVHKGNIEVGDNIPLAEDYYTNTVSGQDYYHYFGNYYPSDVGREYLFFLEKKEDNTDSPLEGYYMIDGIEKGRYPVIEPNAKATFDSSAMTNAQLNLGEDDSELYHEIYADVVDEYFN